MFHKMLAAFARNCLLSIKQSEKPKLHRSDYIISKANIQTNNRKAPKGSIIALQSIEAGSN